MSNNGNQVKKEPDGLFKAIGTQKLMAAIALIVLFMSFWILGNNFAKYNTLVSIFNSSYYIGFTAIDVTLVIITGGVDLSIGTICICCSLISGMLYIKPGLSMPLCAILAILMGSLLGFANGFMVFVTRLPAFIVTLGTMMITRGLGLIVTNAVTMTFPQVFVLGGSFRGIFKLKGAGLPQTNILTGFVLLITLAVLMTILLNKARPGRCMLSLRSNKEATRLSGVNVVKWETLAYIISDLLAGLAGVSYTAVYPTLMSGAGNGFELDTIAGVVIGGTSLAGGMGSVSGILIGVFIMSVLKTGLPFVGVQPHYQLLITEFVLIIAAFVDVLNRRKQGKD